MGRQIKMLRQGVCCYRDVEVLRRVALSSYASGQGVSNRRSPNFAEIGGPFVKICWPRMDMHLYTADGVPNA